MLVNGLHIKPTTTPKPKAKLVKTDFSLPFVPCLSPWLSLVVELPASEKKTKMIQLNVDECFH